MIRLVLCCFVLFMAGCEEVPRQPGEPCVQACECDTFLTCNAGSCAAIVREICTPGEKRCSGETQFTCNAAGTGFENVPCALTCRNGACVETLCEPATSTCIGTDLVTCNEWGLGWDVSGACD